MNLQQLMQFAKLRSQVAIEEEAENEKIIEELKNCHNYSGEEFERLISKLSNYQIIKYYQDL